MSDEERDERKAVEEDKEEDLELQDESADEVRGGMSIKLGTSATDAFK